jgi:hypothetical protein
MTASTKRIPEIKISHTITANLPSSCCKAFTPSMIAALFTLDKLSPKITKLARPVYVMAKCPYSYIAEHSVTARGEINVVEP